MMSPRTSLLLVHLFGLALGVGAASVKLLLLVRSIRSYASVPAFIEVARPITRLIQVGLILLTLSGIVWIFYYDLAITRLLVVKIVLVLGIWILGPIIDLSVEPRFTKLAPRPGEAVEPAFLRSRNSIWRLRGLPLDSSISS
jgi:hypothetical protein